MNKQFVISTVALFVLTLLIGFVVHGLLLGADYAALPGLYRGKEDGAAHFHWNLLAHLSIAVGLTWIYRQGRSGAPWPMQGLRFGLAIALVSTVPYFLIYYAVQPNPGMLVLKQVAFDGAGMLLTGVAAAALNRTD